MESALNQSKCNKKKLTSHTVRDHPDTVTLSGHNKNMSKNTCLPCFKATSSKFDILQGYTFICTTLLKVRGKP